MTECQGCGAWNDASRTLCVLCGTPLAETDEWDAAAELPPLPPLPDGGLRATMPTWLREPPGVVPANTPLVSRIESAPPLGSIADPRTFLTDDDFPQWLRDLAARRAAGEQPPATTASSRRLQEPAPGQPALPSSWPGAANVAASAATIADPEADSVVMPLVAAAVPAPVAPEIAPAANASPAPAAEIPPAAGPAHAPEHRRRREPWETLLLVALFAGVVAAALWALVANGIIGPGL